MNRMHRAEGSRWPYAAKNSPTTSEMRLQKHVAYLGLELAQESILRRQDDELRSVPFIQENLLKVEEDLRLMNLEEEKHKSELEILEKKMQELQSQNRSPHAQICDKNPEASLPRQHEEELRCSPGLKVELHDARRKLGRTTTGQDKNNVSKKVEEMEAEIESLKEKIAEQQDEMNRKDGALEQYERKLLQMEDLHYEFRTYRQKGRAIEEDIRRTMLMNESLKTKLDDLVKKQHDLKTTSEEIKLFVLEREVEKAAKDGRLLTFEDLVTSAGNLRQLIDRAKNDPGIYATLNPVQKKVYELNIALYKRMCTIDDQQKEIKKLRSELYTKEKSIKTLITAADDAELYKKDITNLSYTNDELEYQIWSKNNSIIKLRQTISDLEGRIRSKDKDEKQCTALKEQSIHKPADNLQHEDKNVPKGVKQPVCGTTHLYSKSDRQGARPDLEAAPKDAIAAHKDTRTERSDRTSPPAIPTHRNPNRKPNGPQFGMAIRQFQMFIASVKERPASVNMHRT